jgi:holo-ACP synthase/triphosphoribosyl-dephospho-CoA synthase
MTAHLAEDFPRAGEEKPSAPEGPALSHGEALYVRHGLSGIRGEVSRGFPSVWNRAYPVLCRLLDEGCSPNDAGVAAFLQLLAETEDTNIVHRSDLGELRRIQRETSAFLAAQPSVEDMKKKAAELDGEFIRRNISPGGSADLLAVTLFLYRLFHDNALTRAPES